MFYKEDNLNKSVYSTEMLPIIRLEHSSENEPFLSVFAKNIKTLQ